jgi:hypothetical protein
MWRRVNLVWTDDSEESIASIFRVEKLASEESAWAGGCKLSHQPKTSNCVSTRNDSWTAEFREIWK